MVVAAKPPSAGSPQADLGADPESRVIVRPPLRAALAFVEAARDEALDAAHLARWFDQHLVQPGIMAMPVTVQETRVGAVSLTRDKPVTAGGAARMFRIVAAAYARVNATLAGLLARPADDRFLMGAIVTSRVERISGASGGWRALPQPTDRLSGIVLSLFAADILAHREEYDASLSVCEECGRVSLAPEITAALLRGWDRTRCRDHAG